MTACHRPLMVVAFVAGPLSIVFAANAWGSAEPATHDALPGIVFVSGDILGPQYEMNGYLGGYHWRDGYIYPRSATFHPMERTITPTRPGRNLYTLIPASPDGRLTRITHLTEGQVFDPEPSYEGRRILFSMRRDGEDWFHLYEIDVDGSNLVQLTDGPFNDVSGVYLPDGRIAFVSDRTGYLEEYHEERTETLWTMNGDGTDIRQLTFNPGTVFDPTLLADGRILFSLWDAFMIDVPPFDKHETYLMTVRPDGTEETHFFGAGGYRFFNRERHSSVGLTQAGELPDGTILVQSEMGPSILDPRRGARVEDALWPVFPGTTSVQLGGTTHHVHLSPTGTRSMPYPLSDGRFLMAATLPGARDIGIYVADPATRDTQLVYNDPEKAEYDARPILVPRARPAILPPKRKFTEGAGLPSPLRISRRSRLDGQAATKPDEGKEVEVTGRARFLIVDARRAENPEHEKALARARYFRVIEARYTGVTTSSHTNLQTRILGVVPILPDGSVYFEAPADTPLFLEALNAAGNRLLFDWNYPVTSVPEGSKEPLVQMAYMTARPGEVKSCYGCHAPQNEAPPSAPLMALAREPASVERDVTDIAYCRDEPDEYRTAARIGEAPKYRPWLSSRDPELRRRACALLMAIEDGARDDAPAIAELLNDSNVKVRRAAALALTRLGTLRQSAALLARLADPDWQVRFHCTAALESITGRSVEEAGPATSPQEFYKHLFDTLGGVTGLADGLAKGLQESQANAGARSGLFEAIGRLGPDAPGAVRQRVREALEQPMPDIAAIRAAGWIRDRDSVPLLVPWLTRHEENYHAAEAALALGRIASHEAVEAMWSAVRSEVPNRKVYISRYLQHGPRPEEYALLRGLVLANARLGLDEVPLVIAMLPGTFLEKPRFEDRMRPESQRVLLGRLLLESSGLRDQAVRLLVDVLKRKTDSQDPIYAQILKGINLERPFSEHGRPFPVVEQIEPEQALWLLGCLFTKGDEIPETLLVPFLTSANWRERIDAAVLLGRTGFGPETAVVLRAEAEKPYPFSEIMSIGKGRPDPNFRDKAYFVQTLARHTADVQALAPLADAKTSYRDVRYGLAVGLGMRGRRDGVDLLVEMAIRDPIALVRRQARESLREIGERCRIAGEPVPEVSLPEPMDFADAYRPRGIAGWTGVPIEPERQADSSSQGDEARLAAIEEGLKSIHYRNLNNAQALGAEHMMISGIEPFVEAASGLLSVGSDDALPTFKRLLESPYPVAHYAALRAIARDPQAVVSNDALTEKLRRFGESADTVGFYWACEAVARRDAQDAVPVLARYAQATNPPGVFGPEGMGFGYPAARALARLVGDASHPEVSRLLHTRNVWLKAGALSGLAEARAPGVEALLERAANNNEPAVVRGEALVGLERLTNNRGLSSRRGHSTFDILK